MELGRRSKSSLEKNLLHQQHSTSIGFNGRYNNKHSMNKTDVSMNMGNSIDNYDEPLHGIMKSENRSWCI